VKIELEFARRAMAQIPHGEMVYGISQFSSLAAELACSPLYAAHLVHLNTFFVPNARSLPHGRRLPVRKGFAGRMVSRFVP
jgi:hypothetical protein